MIGNENVWIDIDCKGLSGIQYSGRMCVKKYLTHRERAESVRVAEKLCYGISQDIEFRALLATVAFINQHVVECDAKWWKGNGVEGSIGIDFIDEEPIWEIAAQISKLQKPEAEAVPEEPKE